ncbi:MAG: putative 2-aminoethylphosphonate ABC transporter permease subunit [Dongiaceae bacterium]
MTSVPASLDPSVAAVAPAARPRIGAEGWIMRGGLALLALYLLLTVILPLYAMLAKGFENKDGDFIGAANFIRYFADPALSASLWNSFAVAVISTAITIGLAFGYAVALSRTWMPAKGFFKAVALVPLLAPSLLPALALIYLFGNQGVIRGVLLGHSIYGPIGIVIGEVFFAFPHAVLIIMTSLAAADQRLYEAAQSLRASRWRIFWTVTLPGCRYGLISACFVVFTLVFTDFGVPKVIGGSFNVLATDVYKQVIGQFNFQMGAVVGLLLLTPAVISFLVDRAVQRRQVALLSARAVPYEPKPNPFFDRLSLAFCALVGLFVLGILAVAAFGSLITYWPYDMSLTWRNYDFNNIDTNGWGAYWNSLKMSFATAILGTAIVFVGAYLVEKGMGFARGRAFIHLMCMIPLAVPGVVLGLSYIFFFNSPSNPLNVIYLTLTILVIATITHFYTVPHLTALTALKALDAEFESVSASLKVPFYKTFWRVTVPICLPAILDISVYFFVNAMTTVSAVVFLYGSSTKLASISILNMDDAGNTAHAAAMGMTIVATSAGLRLLHALATRGLNRRTQAWRRR